MRRCLSKRPTGFVNATAVEVPPSSSYRDYVEVHYSIILLKRCQSATVTH